MKIFNRFLTKIKKENLVETGDKIVLGFSGGPDSVFLLEMFMKLKKIYQFDIILAHVNHLLRGEDAEIDEEFTREIGEKYNLPIYIKRIDITSKSKKENIGLEEAGRAARYEFFDEILKKERCNKIALAHNLDDQIETFLFRMIRGTSLLGLEGINSHKNFIRPINELYKSEIMEYLNNNGISYRIDLTNFENEFTRNSIRLDLIPFIEKRYNKKFKDKITTLIEEIRDINSLLEVDYKNYELESDILSLDLILKEQEYIQRKIINNFLSAYSIEVTHEKIKGILKVFSSEGSKEINLGKNYILKKQYNRLSIEIEQKKELKETQEVLTLKIPGKVEFLNYIIEAEISDNAFGKNSFLTNLKEGDILRVRNRREGDRIIPCGMENSKKVKDILINEKIPKEQRDNIPILTKDEEIVWIAGVRGSEKYKASNKNGERVKLSVRRKDKWQG